MRITDREFVYLRAIARSEDQDHYSDDPRIVGAEVLTAGIPGQATEQSTARALNRRGLIGVRDCGPRADRTTWITALGFEAMTAHGLGCR